MPELDPYKIECLAAYTKVLHSISEMQVAFLKYFGAVTSTEQARGARVTKAAWLSYGAFRSRVSVEATHRLGRPLSGAQRPVKFLT